ncbi:LPS export ABC transporter periplasmic protein LptC [Candidatus Pelagibacter bacterium nBUS_25]|uniref:LPS export ABC transporter periplasmic protein LptC n=1 Tax=Candidatus Pelagibacter bacterium nBUS_25 TaxID=3374187 RepID=UPI003EBAA74E
MVDEKKKFLKIILILSLIIITWFVYLEYFKKDKSSLSKSINPTTKIEDKTVYNSNIIKDINYTSRDLKGNEYTLVAKEGEIDLKNNDIIFLTDVTAYIKLVKNSELIVITSNYGKYNTINYDTIFSKNVKIDYVDNIITGDYLDFSMMKNLLIISQNVVYKNLENTMKADVIELDTISKDTKIFMYNSNEQVNVTNIK